MRHVTTIKELDVLMIDDIIRLPYFYSLEKMGPNAERIEIVPQWKITFVCPRIIADGVWGLLDEQYNTPFIVRYKLIEFEPSERFIPLMTHPYRSSSKNSVNQ